MHRCTSAEKNEGARRTRAHVLQRVTTTSPLLTPLSPLLPPLPPPLTSPPLGFFQKPSGQICVVLTFSKVKKGTPIQKKTSEVPFGHSDMQRQILFRNISQSVPSALFYVKWANSFVLTSSEFTKEVSLQRRGFRSTVRAKINGDTQQVFNNCLFLVCIFCAAVFWEKPGGLICVVLTLSAVQNETTLQRIFILTKFTC